jgi:predicted DNA-binding transcriptional regulator AlpA
VDDVLIETHLRVADLAGRWQCRPAVIYGMRYRGEGPPAIRIGRELRFRLSDVHAWEREHLEERERTRAAQR